MFYSLDFAIRGSDVPGEFMEDVHSIFDETRPSLQPSEELTMKSPTTNPQMIGSRYPQEADNNVDSSSTYLNK